MEYSKIVPDGVVAFFPSYLYMESIVAAWNDMVRIRGPTLSHSCVTCVAFKQGILNEVWKHKLIFVETPDANETSIALENYRRVRFAVALHIGASSQARHATTVEVPFCCQLLEGRYPKGLTLTITMAEL